MLRSFIEEAGEPGHRIAVLGDDGPLGPMLGDVFGEQVPVDTKSELDGDPAALEDDPAGSEAAIEDDLGTVVLLENETPVARSGLSELYDAVLAVNSDLFLTGARELEDVQLPDVLANLDDVRFRLRGYPLAHKEKLFLIVVSRWIERRAWETNAGTLRSSFQRLSRLDDEIGTRRVYERLGDADVDVHVYGVGDAEPDLDATVHAGSDPNYRRSWFVVFRSGDAIGESAALVCLETDSRIWDGFFTYDRERTAEIDDYISRAF